MAKRDDRTFIFVHDGMPEHWKVEDLSDSAFRLLVTLWCWCSRQRTDGLVPVRKWLRSGSESDRSELVDNGLFELRSDGSAVVHDYLEHQRSRDDIRKRSEAGQKANHVRHHVRTGNWNPNCNLCVFPGQDPTPPPPSGPDSESDPNQVQGLTPPESQSRAEQSRADINQSARASERQATRLLADRYGLIDKEAADVLDHVRRRATGPITHLARYLTAMAEGDLADIVKAVMDATDRPRPPLAAVPDLPAEPAPPPRTGTPPPTGVLDELRAEKGWRRAAP
jgi:hypothetical protein